MFRTLALLLCFSCAAQAQSSVRQYVALGDSLGEGVQSAESTYRTQFSSYPNLIAGQLGVWFPLPLIKGGAFTGIGSVRGRSRVFPNLPASNLAVSGADTTTILFERAGLPIEDEADLVLQPRTGSQVEIAESIRAPFMTCVVGSNDALGTVLAFDQLDASQLTPLPVFAENYRQIVQRLTAWQAKVVFANVPNVTEVGFLADGDDLLRFLGQDFGLPAGSYTTVVAMMLLKLGLNDGSLLSDPNWVLDPSEVAVIENTVHLYNAVISAEAGSAGMPVVDIHSFLDYVHRHPISVGNIQISTRYLGGVYSLDGVHPSNIGHAMFANEFLKSANAAFGWQVPLISPTDLLNILVNDPFVDFDQDLSVPGRPFAGIIETLGPFLGISGDANQFALRVDPAMGPRFMKAYFAAIGRDPEASWTFSDAKEALRTVFGLKPKGPTPTP